MTDKSIKGTIGLEVTGADSAKQDLNSIQTAAEQMGSGGAAGATALTNAFKNVERSAENVTKKISDGRMITTKDGAAIIQTFEVLQKELEQTFGTLAKAPLEIQNAFKKAESQMKATVANVRDLTDAVDDQKGTLKEGGASWTGLGDAAGKAAGKFGGPLSIIGMVIAALKEGFDIGKKIAIWLGADWKLVDEAVDRLQSKARVLFQDLIAGATATAGIVKAIVTRDWQGLKDSVNEATNAALKFQRDGSDALTKYGTDWDRLHPSIKAVEQAQKDAAEASKKAAEEARKHAEEQQRLKDALDKVTDALAKNAAELAKATGTAHDAELQTISSASQLGYYERSLASAQAALEAQKQKVAEATAAWGDNSIIVRQAVETQQRLEDAVGSAQQRVDEESTSLKSSQSAMSSAESAMKSLGEKKKELVEKEKEAKAAIDAGTTSSTAQAAAVTATAQAADAASAALAKIGSVDPSGSLIGALDAVIQRLYEVKKAAIEAAGALDRLSKAGDDAAGIDYSEPSEDTMSLTPGGKPSMRKSGYGA